MTITLYNSIFKIAPHLAILLCYILFCKLSFAQYECTEKIYNTTNGLSLNSVNALKFDNNGYLWIGANDGLIRFDGVNFTSVLSDTMNLEKYSDFRIRNIFTFKDVKKTIATSWSGKIFSITNGKIHLTSSPEKSNDRYPKFHGHFPSYELFTKFFANSDELRSKHNWTADKLYIIPINDEDFMVPGPSSDLVLFYYKRGQKAFNVPVKCSIDLVFKINNYTFFLNKTKKQVYVYDQEKRLFNEVNINESDLSEPLGSNRTFLWNEDDNTSYFVNQSSFYKADYDPIKKLVTLKLDFRTNSEPLSWAELVIEPYSSFLFMTTYTDGLYQYRKKAVSQIKINLDNTNIVDPLNAVHYTVLKNGDNSVILPTGTEIIEKNGGFEVKKLGKLIAKRESLSKFGDSIIICLRDEELYYYKKSDGYKNRYEFNQNFNKLDLKSTFIALAEGDSVWVAGYENLHCVTRTSFKHYYGSNVKGQRTSFFALSTLHRISDSTMYISCMSGLYILRTKPPLRIDTVKIFNDKQIRHVLEYNGMRILSVFKNGIYIEKNNSFYIVPLLESQYKIKYCHNTYIDGNGYIWVTTNQGLYQSRFAEVLDAAINKTSVPFFYKYGLVDGIANTEFNGNGSPSYAVLPNEDVFYPSMGGIVTFNAKTLKPYFLKSELPIDKLILDEKEVQIFNSDSIFVDDNTDFINIEINAPHLGEIENLLIEYKLDSGEWKSSNEGYPKHLLISDLQPGSHCLQIRKRVGFGINDYIYKKLYLYRDIPITSAPWFYPSLTLAIISLFILAIRINSNSLNKKRIFLQQKVDEQTSELSKQIEMKEMLINIISHDMVSPLKYISLISGVLGKSNQKKNIEETGDALLTIKSTADSLHSSSVGIINWMKFNKGHTLVERKKVNIHGFIKDICSVFEPLAREKNIELVNSVNNLSVANLDQNIFGIILNNLISNAIKYSEKGRVEILFKSNYLSEESVLTIKDEGIGMSNESIITINEVLKGNFKVLKTINKTSTGLGYIIIADLIAIHGLKISLNSKIGEGTSIYLYIPN